MKFWIAVNETYEENDPVVGAGPTPEGALRDLNQTFAERNLGPVKEPTFWIEFNQPAHTYTFTAVDAPEK